MAKAKMSFGQICNMCFGFFGIQIGFALQNANSSRIFQTLGANLDALPILWIAAPVTGLLVQPVIGYLSDRTWGPLGRRRPYFVVGAALTTAALIFMPNAPVLWAAAIGLWLMDAAINVTMEPFRAFVGDLLPDEQRTAGFAMQSVFIGLGAVLAGALPMILTQGFGVANVAPAGHIPPTVKLSFLIGAVALATAVMWTVLTTREYPPDAVAAQAADEPKRQVTLGVRDRALSDYWRGGALFLALGLLGALAIRMTPNAKQELYVLAGMVALFGLLQFLAGALRASGRAANGVTEIVDDLFAMPRLMLQLAVVQFFSWFGLFAMWIYTTPAVTRVHFHATDVASAAYNDGANYVGLMFGLYNGVAALAAFGLPILAAHIGRKETHAVALACGALGLISIALVREPPFLLGAMVGVGIAWASILATPYSILSGSLPTQKMGVYMGIFNIFIVIPQILAATLLGAMVQGLFGGQPLAAVAVGGGALAVGALASMGLKDTADPLRRKTGAAAP